MPGRGAVNSELNLTPSLHSLFYFAARELFSTLFFNFIKLEKKYDFFSEKYIFLFYSKNVKEILLREIF